MNWQLIIDPYARKYIKRIPHNDAKHITVVLRELAANPYAGDIARMDKEENIWRRRVGSYRIFYEVHTAEKLINVFEIQRRTSKTY